MFFLYFNLNSEINKLENLSKFCRILSTRKYEFIL